MKNIKKSVHIRGSYFQIDLLKDLIKNLCIFFFKIANLDLQSPIEE